MSRAVNSLYFARLQLDAINIAELVELTTHGKTFRWTTCNQTLVSSGNVFDPLPGGTQSGPDEDTSLSVSAMHFTVVNSGEMRQLIDGIDLDMANVVIRRVYIDTPDLGSMEMFRGQIGDYTYTRDTIDGQIRNVFGGVNGSFPWLTYKDTCAWQFGKKGCGFDTSSITFSTALVGASTPLTVQATSGTITNSFGPGALERGRVTLITGANSGQVRSVRANSGDAIDLSHGLPFAVSSGDQFQCYPGCRKRMIIDCVSKYNNVQHYLGFPWFPRQEQVF